MTQPTEEQPLSYLAAPVANCKASLHFILIYNAMSVYGGIQSIIFRLSKLMIEEGHKVTLITGKNHLEDHLHPGVDVIVEENYCADSIFNQMKFQDARDVHVITFAPPAMALGYVLGALIVRNARVPVSLIQGVFHPRDFFRENEKRHGHYLNFLLAHLLGTKYIFFMNKVCLDTHKSFFKASLKTSHIIHIPIDYRAYAWKSKDTAKIRICSVGRIVPFKAYNFSAPQIVRLLNERGVSVSWDIFGHGTHEWMLEREIEAGGSQYVKFLGPVNLDDFDRTVSSYDLFVGMGTAALQAAQLGVPTICAIDNEPDMSYGFIYNAPEGCVGELVEGMTGASIASTILDYSRMNGSERRRVSLRCRESTLNYSVENFLSNLQLNSHNLAGDIGLLPALYARFYLWTMRDNKLRRFYRNLRGAR